MQFNRKRDIDITEDTVTDYFVLRMSTSLKLDWSAVFLFFLNFPPEKYSINT